MSNELKVELFSQIDLADPFFDSLKADYPEFEAWFASKANKSAFVLRNEEGKIEGFLYPKFEKETISDVIPSLPKANWLKVGTFKIDGHGTKLGERFFKKIFDLAIEHNVDSIYVTVYPKHEGLILLFNKYGFVQQAEKPDSRGGTEMVLVRNMRNLSNDLIKDYPLVRTHGHQKYLLSIYPEFHTQLLPDSILRNESVNMLRDLSHTNSIHKVYICKMPVEVFRSGDILIMYRTKDPTESGSAEYKSVATSICVVEDVQRASDFRTEADFLKYCKPYSVFSESQLKEYYVQRSSYRVVKFTYNAALSKRLTRHSLADDVGLDRNERWGFIKLTDDQFRKIVDLGGVNENLIID